MTIRLSYRMHQALQVRAHGEVPRHSVHLGDELLAHADTREEAEQAKRAFENVLAPRFTRDEAIAIVRSIPEFPADRENRDACMVRAGMRAALEALAAAGVFLPACSRCETNDSDHFCESMADKLDAAGIR